VCWCGASEQLTLSSARPGRWGGCVGRGGGGAPHSCFQLCSLLVPRAAGSWPRPRSFYYRELLESSITGNAGYKLHDDNRLGADACHDHGSGRRPSLADLGIHLKSTLRNGSKSCSVFIDTSMDLHSNGAGSMAEEFESSTNQPIIGLGKLFDGDSNKRMADRYPEVCNSAWQPVLTTRMPQVCA
jgi:hypothetical protein